MTKTTLSTKLLDFVDSLSDIHSPLVNNYISFKDNIFLNTSRKQAPFLELMGNWCLQPVRYLFSGKTVTQIDTNTLRLQQTFDYAKDSKPVEVLKTVLAVLSLPISLIVGSTIKGLSYSIPDTRQHHQFIHSTITSTAVHVDESIYHNANIPQIFSNEQLMHCNVPMPELSQRQQAQVQAVHDAAEILEKHNIPHWLDCGTLLGAYRHGNMIPWDTDVDMGVPAYEFHNVMAALRTLDPNKYVVQDWSCARCPNMFARVLIKEINTYIDLYHHEINPNDNTMTYTFSWKDSPWLLNSVKERELAQVKPINLTDVFPLKKAQFGNKLLRVPAHWENFLKVKYDENLSPCKIWNPSTRAFEKVQGHPYWTHGDY